MICRKAALALVLVPSLLLVSCAREAQEEAAGEALEMAMTWSLEDLGEAIAEMDTRYVEAFTSGDAAAISGLYVDDAMRMPPNMAMLRGKEAIEAYFAGMFGATGARALTLEPVEFGTSGNLAYVVGRYSYTIEVEGAATPEHDEGKYLALSTLTEDGTWKMLAQIWNSDLPAE
ncbi:MAG: hypothetical protein AMS25_09910 [Gemmatimonas sp. SM23_52]|nr:MAG: hypothetical protein AMS25_09910 [Gemmatimonas sp. SM23_52]